MSQSLFRRFASCSLRSCSRNPVRQSRASRRTLVTIQRGRPERVPLPADIIPQFFPQLTPRMRPDYAKREIKIHEPPPSEIEHCKEPRKFLDAQELAKLDPTGVRTKLFEKANRDRPMPGDVLLCTFKSGENFSGVIISIKGSGPHKAVLMRNQLTGIGTEMSVRVHSPEVQSMEIVRKAAKRARRAKLTYLRLPKHDQGSVQKVVDQYLRERAQLTGKKTGATTVGGQRKKKGRR